MNADKITIGFIKRNHIFLKTVLLLPVILFLACTSGKKQADEIVLAQIGAKKISVNEFLRRSELAIRPNNFKNKQTALNNLISEKILALEAERNDKLLHNPLLQGTLKGLKEQLMRDKLYEAVAFNKVQVDSQEINTVYRLSIREYELEFYTIHHQDLAQKIAATLDSVPEFADEMFKEVEEILSKKSVHKVNYKDPDDEAIHEALFTKPLKLGTVLGPIRLSNGDHIVMKVLNWVDYPLISGEDQRVRWNKVQEKRHQTKAGKLWHAYQANIMRGKKIEFDKQSFKILSDWSRKKYLSGSQNDSLRFQITEIPPVEPVIDLAAPFFTIDNKIWTVDDFRKELMSHPLVFRTKYLNNNNFAEQFKLAVVDMVRDHYLTQEAYKKSFDQLADINKTVEMWKDAYLAVGQQKTIMNSALEQGAVRQDDNWGKQKYWEAYLLNLQKQYSRTIRIDYEELQKISLTNVDFFAIRPGVPYPAAMPGFPVLIASANLDYAQRVKPTN